MLIVLPEKYARGVQLWRLCDSWQRDTMCSIFTVTFVFRLHIDKQCPRSKTIAHWEVQHHGHSKLAKATLVAIKRACIAFCAKNVVRQNNQALARKYRLSLKWVVVCFFSYFNLSFSFWKTLWRYTKAFKPLKKVQNFRIFRTLRSELRNGLKSPEYQTLWTRKVRNIAEFLH